MIPYIRFKNATFAKAQNYFFSNFSWTIHQDENWIISGKIGAGKTSLVQALTGKYFLKQGQLKYPFIAALHPSGKASYELKKKFIKVVSFKDDARAFDPHSYFYSQRFNSFAADGTITVWEYLIEAGFSEYEKEQVDLIKRTGVFELLDLERIKLSSGQSRKLLITKAILQKPKLLIIDNPYMGLDAKSRLEFNELLDYLVAEEGIQLILAGQYEVLPNCISHELELDDFKTVYEGTVRESGGGNQAIGSALPLKENSLVAKIKTHFQAPNNLEDWQAIFQMKAVSVAYFGKKILDNINWEVKLGEKWALFGANGSGKSTLLSLLFGDHPQAYANEIYLFDQKRGMGQSIWDIKKRTGYTSAELHYFFNANLTAEDAIITGLFDHVYLKRAASEKELELVNLLMAYFKVTSLKPRLFQTLSTGEQKIILLIRALIKNPPLILLDEPFQGFDWATIEKAKALLNTILSPQHALVFITHYRREIPAIVDKEFLL